MIRPIAPDGLHEFVDGSCVSQYARRGTRAIDLGTGRGAMAERLQVKGCDVVAVDLSPNGFEADLPHVILDLNRGDFASELGVGVFDLATAIEVIEHVESPIGFLRNVGRLLSPTGVAILTTPNVDSLPARIRHLLSGKIRMMDERAEPSHISPIFIDLFQRQFLPLVGLRLQKHLLFPPDGFQASRKSVAWTMRKIAWLFPRDSILGDHHVFVLERPR